MTFNQTAAAPSHKMRRCLLMAFAFIALALTALPTASFAGTDTAGNVLATDNDVDPSGVEGDLYWAGQALNLDDASIDRDIIAAGDTLSIRDCMVGCGVYEISDKDEQALDVYAGVPYFYQKQTMQVQCVWDVTTRREVLHNIEAILYTLPASHPLGVPSRRYLQECKSGYDDFHFSFLPLRQALIDSSPEPHTK